MQSTRQSIYSTLCAHGMFLIRLVSRVFASVHTMPRKSDVHCQGLGLIRCDGFHRVYFDFVSDSAIVHHNHSLVNPAGTEPPGQLGMFSSHGARCTGIFQG